MPLADAIVLRNERLGRLRDSLAEALGDSDSGGSGGCGLTLEVGCGHGHYLTAYAAAHPDEICVAIDLLAERIRRARRKTERAGLRNVIWLHGSVELLLEALPARVRLGRIFVLFSDPWPKRRHWKNRVMQTKLLNALAERSAPGTQLYFRTDHAPYFEWTRALVQAHPRWRLDAEARWPFEAPTVFQTRAASHQSLIASLA